MKYLIVIIMFFEFNIYAQKTINYQSPPKEIADIINSPGFPDISINPQKDWLLYLENEYSYPSLKSLKEPELKLAGIRVNPLNNFPTRMNPANGLSLKRANTDSTKIFVKNLPKKLSITFVKWSPNGKKIAFCQLNNNSTELWIIDVLQAKAKKIFDYSISFPMDYNPIVWSTDNEHIFCLIVPVNRGIAPTLEDDTGPIIQENEGKAKASRTVQDLLKDKHDESLFEYYFNSKLVSVNIDNGKYKQIGRDGVFLNFDVSPNGDYILLKYVNTPYSYKVNVYSFPSIIEIYSVNGELLKRVADLPISEKILGRDATTSLPRGHTWRSDRPATLYWIEALDGGNPEIKVEFRDKIVELDAPFSGKEYILHKTKNRFFNVFWGDDKSCIFVERLWKDRKMQWILINPNISNQLDMIADFSFDNAYEMPGEPIQESNLFGRKTLLIDNENNIMISGYSYSDKDGLMPTLSKFNLKTKVRQQIWQSRPPFIEYFIAFKDISNIIVVRQSNAEPNNYAFINLLKKSILPITFQKNLLVGLNTIKKKDLKYKRADGIELNATLYFPANFDSTAGPLPTLLWAYPTEYKNKASASQNYTSPYNFIGYYTFEMLLAAKGYAVIDYASFPIVGEGSKEPNDTYLEQIYQNAKAAIDEGVRLKIVDSAKVAVAGHSYGAFLAANLLTNTKLFRTGIAQSGAYNRTLTPYGFQSEYRSYWQIPDIYNKISPFQNADKLTYPIMLIHGDADNNPGTFTLQSERYFDALRGQGATVRFVKLPFESHSYQAKESILHVSWEVYEWLEKHLKNQKKEDQTITSK